MSHKYYIAGPMSGYPNNNIFEFELAEKLIRKRKDVTDIFNPAISEESLRVQEGLIEGPEAYRICMRADLVWICNNATHIYMLNGWERSRGATAEHALAICLDLKIEYH